jgi:hypothetical protein
MIREKLSLHELSRQDGGAICLGVSPKRPATSFLKSDQYPFLPGLNCAVAVSLSHLLHCHCVYRHLYAGTGKSVPEFLFGSLLAQSPPDSFTPFISGNVERVRMEYRRGIYPVAVVTSSAEFTRHINHAIRPRN